MSDYSPPLLMATREITRDVCNSKQRNVKCIAEADKPGGFIGSINVKAASQVAGLTGNNANHISAQAGKAGNQVWGIKPGWLKDFSGMMSSRAGSARSGESAGLVAGGFSSLLGGR